MAQIAMNIAQKIDLFTARTDGYHTYRIPGIVTAADGSILAYCEARHGTGSDWDPIDILMRRSHDDGLTWDAPTTLVNHANFDGGGVHNCVLTTDPDTGELHALFCLNYARVFYMCSTDNGHSFSKPVEITHVFEQFRRHYAWKVCATGPGHGIQLKTGRLVVPVWLSTGEGKGGHRPSVVASIYSDDKGASWHCGEIIARHDPRIINPSETAAVELSDGRVLFNLRNESPQHRRLTTVSPNGAHNWSTPAFDDALLEPQCMGSILKLKQRSNTIIFANPSNLDQTLPGAQDNVFDRKKLTLCTSYDDCRSWAHRTIIEAGSAGYSDLAETFTGTLLCFYERGYLSHMTNTKHLTIVQLTG